MIPCPHCDREFDKRAGLMRHIQGKHPVASPADLARQVLEAEEPGVTYYDYDPLSDAIPDPAEVRHEAMKRAFDTGYVPVTPPPPEADMELVVRAAGIVAPELPLRLRQVAFRVGNGYESDQMDVRYLLRLAQIGHALVEELRPEVAAFLAGVGGEQPDDVLPKLIADWDEAVS